LGEIFGSEVSCSLYVELNSLIDDAEGFGTIVRFEGSVKSEDSFNVEAVDDNAEVDPDDCSVRLDSLTGITALVSVFV